VSLIADNYDELFRNTVYKRTEKVPGAFFEYTYSPGEKYSVILGIRGDQNNISGFFLTPRMHMKYEPMKGTVIRLAAGRGQRTANIFAENTSALVSSRQVTILNPLPGKSYGLEPEVAWNEGISIDQTFRLFGRNGSFGLDFFRTDFQNQVVVDLDRSARQVNFYNLEGRSYSNSFQAEINYEVLRKLELRLAYRLFDVKETYHGELLQKPLLAKHRGFANISYETGNWKFDYTITFNGVKRIPFTGDNPAQFKLNNTSPSYLLMNAQVSKTFGKKFPVDVYLGSENITNYYQDRVIVSASQPFGQYFDASLVWGPVSGRMFYTGFRFKIK
jgi:outer membrane receptor for ferrienterochelin and colicin